MRAGVLQKHVPEVVVQPIQHMKQGMPERMDWQRRIPVAKLLINTPDGHSTGEAQQVLVRQPQSQGIRGAQVMLHHSRNTHEDEKQVVELKTYSGMVH